MNDYALMAGSPDGALKFRGTTVCEASRNAILGAFLRVFLTQIRLQFQKRRFLDWPKMLGSAS